MEYENTIFQQQSQKILKNSVLQFKKISFSFALFKIFFLTLIFVELALFFLFLPLFASSAPSAIFLCLLFLTGFTYLVLYFYLQAKKPDSLSSLKDRFIHACRQGLSLPKGIAEHHLSIVNASLKLSSCLNDLDVPYYNFSKFIPFSRVILEKMLLALSKEDVFKMKEILLWAAVKEHIDQIKSTPTDLEVHASLANTYINLSKLYESKLDLLSLKFFYKTERDAFKEKAETIAKRAIEEFKILSEYAPNDPWVHAQLAQSFRSLSMPEDEAKELEILLRLSPQDQEVLFRLGILNFEMGKNATGLKIYEQLKKSSYKKADDLLVFYGNIKLPENLDEAQL